MDYIVASIANPSEALTSFFNTSASFDTVAPEPDNPVDAFVGSVANAAETLPNLLSLS
ncbi:hypothetical protein [Dietzia sp.]|uniref:hypothetical protein n=1 Tax=Dietzia sp. TaxID=1871616 RepID=UPI002FD8D4D4